MPYYELEAINSVMASAQEHINNAEKYQDVTFHWITLKQIADEDFSSQFLTAFDYQIIANNAGKLTSNLLGNQESPIEYKNADYAVMICDSRPQLENSAELLYMGQLIDNDEKWQFYKAENCERPSNTELKYLKGIIISGSELSIKNTKKKEDDEKIFKKCLL